MKRINYISAAGMLLLTAGMLLFSCKDEWEERSGKADPSFGSNLLEKIKENPELSKFSEYLVKTGYDSVLVSSKTFTVWAPTNAALQNLDAAVVSDPVKLKAVIGNHIANQSYFTNMPNPLLKIKSLTGKGIVFTKTTLDESTITKADQNARNGVLHIVSQTILPKQNAYEFLMSSTIGSAEKAYIQSLDTSIFTASLAVPTGAVDPKTGLPVYKPGTGFRTINKFLQKTNISSEDSLYTFVVLTDAAFETEKNKLRKYFVHALPKVTDSLTKGNMIRDMVFKGLFTPDNLPDSVLTVDSVKIHLDKSAIVSTQRVSNGIVYVMNRLDYKLENNKFKALKIEGESPVSTQSNKSSNTTYPVRRNPADATSTAVRTTYTSVLVSNHGVASFWLQYRPTLNSMKYKVYWRAPRDFSLTGTPVLFPQRVTFLLPATVTLPYTNVNLVTNTDGTFGPDYREILLGEYTVAAYGPTPVYLVSNTVTTNGLNTLFLDYIKLVPVP